MITMTENGVVIYGTSWCGDCRRVKKVLERRGVDYAWVDVERKKGAREEMLRLNGGDRGRRRELLEMTAVRRRLSWVAAGRSPRRAV
jgi:hypothetical protein